MEGGGSRRRRGRRRRGRGRDGMPYSRASSTRRSKKGRSTHCGGGVRREVEDERLGARGHAGEMVFQLGQKLVAVVEGDADDVGAGDDGAVDVDGVAGVGDEDGVARVEDGEAEVGDAFLGADGDDGFGLGVEIDVVAALVPVADGLAQAREGRGRGSSDGCAASARPRSSCRRCVWAWRRRGCPCRSR